MTSALGARTAARKFSRMAIFGPCLPPILRSRMTVSNEEADIVTQFFTLKTGQLRQHVMTHAN